MTEVIRELEYVGLFLMMLGENLFPPIPSEAILPLAGYLAQQGDLAFVWAVLVATAGSVAGALILYWIGRRGGRPLVLRHGRMLRVSAADLDRAEGWFTRRGDWVVLLGRLVPLARSVVSIPAGTLRMPLPRFLVLTTIGSAVWNTVLVSAGWLLGAEWEAVEGVMGPASRVIAVVLVAAALVAAFLWWRRRSADPSSL
jgi:membrane protein DedA with SNARE-associated domain